MTLDALPRLRIRTVAGDVTVDPWTGGKLPDLSRLGLRIEPEFSTAGHSFTVKVRTPLGLTVVLDPFHGGTKPDLTAWGITGWEVVYGPDEGSPLDLRKVGRLAAGLGTSAVAALLARWARMRGKT